MQVKVCCWYARCSQAWAFGKLKYVPSGGLPAVIAAAARRRMSEFSPQNLSNLVWSFVYMHHADEALLAAAARMVAGRVAEFKPQELANIVWAFASLGYRDEQMVRGEGGDVRRGGVKETGKRGLRARGGGRRGCSCVRSAWARLECTACEPNMSCRIVWVFASFGLP